MTLKNPVRTLMPMIAPLAASMILVVSSPAHAQPTTSYDEQCLDENVVPLNNELARARQDQAKALENVDTTYNDEVTRLRGLFSGERLDQALKQAEITWRNNRSETLEYWSGIITDLNLSSALARQGCIIQPEAEEDNGWNGNSNNSGDGFISLPPTTLPLPPIPTGNVIMIPLGTGPTTCRTDDDGGGVTCKKDDG